MHRLVTLGLLGLITPGLLLADATVVIRSSYGGSVHLDGEYIGAAPMTLRGLEPGQHRISVTARDVSREWVVHSPALSTAEKTLDVDDGRASAATSSVSVSRPAADPCAVPACAPAPAPVTVEYRSEVCCAPAAPPPPCYTCEEPVETVYHEQPETVVYEQPEVVYAEPEVVYAEPVHEPPPQVRRRRSRKGIHFRNFALGLGAAALFFKSRKKRNPWPVYSPPTVPSPAPAPIPPPIPDPEPWPGGDDDDDDDHGHDDCHEDDRHRNTRGKGHCKGRGKGHHVDHLVRGFLR